MTDVAARYDELRPLMFSVAYGMLGSVAEAEDVIQEAFLRMHRADGHIDSPAAYAVTVTTRLAIDHLRAARARREVYVGSWLPEPLVTGDRATPASARGEPEARAEATERLSIALLLLLERLSPVERAVLLLRDVFAYDYQRIGEIVGRAEPNCRQILVRARERVRQGRPRFDATPAQRDALVDRFFRACDEGDLAALEAILTEDIEFAGDGGGRAPAVRTPVTGRRRVARFLLGLFRQARAGGYRVERVSVNGAPGGRVLAPTGETFSVFDLDVDAAGIRAVHNVLNPEKLAHLNWAAAGHATVDGDPE